MLRRGLIAAVAAMTVNACASSPRPVVNKPEPPSVVSVAPFVHFACSVCAIGLQDDRRALRELAIAAELAPDDPYLAALWREAKRREKERK